MIAGGDLRTRVNPSLIRKGYDLAGVEMDVETAGALDALEDAVSDEDLWFDLPIERRQLRYLANGRVPHYRSAYTDGDGPAAKRRP